MKNCYFYLLFFINIAFANAQSFNYNGIKYNITDSVNFYVEVGDNFDYLGIEANIPNTVVYNSTIYTVTSIMAGSFAFSTDLILVSIPNTVTSIGDLAFNECPSLTSVTIPNSVTSIGALAFGRCPSLASITIPNSVTSIGDAAFKECNSLTSIIIPNSVTSLGDDVFYKCHNLASITIPNSLTRIGINTFAECHGLTSVVIPNSVTSIGEHAFGYCVGLNSVYIPNSVTNIGEHAFGLCYNLISVTVEWQNPLPINQNVFSNVNINSTTLNVPSGTGFLYETTPVWTEFNIAGGEPRGCWAEISAGGQHTLAIAQDGTLWAWGNKDFGQLGNNTTSGYETNPIQISNEPNWAFVSAGEFHSLAIKKDGTLWAWGDNSYGQLGDNSTTQRNVPVQIGAATDWVGVYAGFEHSMARKADNSLWSWGDNSFGELGNGNTIQQNTPVQVGSDTHWQTVSLGRSHNVALKTNGQLWSWGRNNYGQLGIGNTTNQLNPIQIGTDTNWKVIELGDYHNIALKNDGTIYSWGENALGQLGLGDTTQRNTPTQIGTATDWSYIAAGLYNSYAVKSTGQLWVCGDNFKGQIGNGNFTQQNSLVQVGSATDWYSVIAGNESAIAQKTTGTFMSWGDNQSGQLGNGNTSSGQNSPGVMGCSGNILSFDGVDDRVVITNNGIGVLGDNSNNESYTIEMKVKFNSLNSINILFAKYGILPTSGFVLYTDSSGYLNFGQSYGGVLSTATNSSSLSIDTWYRIVATFDYATKTHKLYVNGVLVDSKTETGVPNFSNSDAGIGYSYGEGSGKFDGDFNDFRVWNVARNAVEVSSYTRTAQVVSNASNLLLQFKFNQGIANANNAGLTALANEVLGGPVGILQNFALTGATSNWTQDVTANETLDNNSFTITDTVLVYPNPSAGIFNLVLEQEAIVEVFDLLGNKILASKVNVGNSKIDISNYQSGLYIIKLTSENGSVINKVVKE